MNKKEDNDEFKSTIDHCILPQYIYLLILIKRVIAMVRRTKKGRLKEVRIKEKSMQETQKNKHTGRGRDGEEYKKHS